MISLLAYLCLLFFSLPRAISKVVERVKDLPGLEYDFIIIGGVLTKFPRIDGCILIFVLAGTAGNVIANRLTENAHHSVLVLEAGVS
jgi:hypothetical protein